MTHPLNVLRRIVILDEKDQEIPIRGEWQGSWRRGIDLYRQRVFEEGYLASEVAGFLACYPSNVSRALQKDDGVNRLRQV